MSRLIQILAACASLAILMVAQHGLAAENTTDVQQPNVVLIVADDLGWGDLGCMGADDLATPNIDSLADDGMRWTNFYANCPVCSPTRASILSGRYPDAVGVPGVIRTHSRNSWGYLSPEVTLLPAKLQEVGYHTAMVGKWHLGLAEPNIPNRRGFDFFHGFLGDMMDDYFHHRRHDVNYMRHNETEIDPEGHATDLFSAWARDFLQTASDKQPFFLYLAYNAPHTPIQPPEDYLEAYQDRHPEVSARRAKLAAFIEHLDAGVGRVLAALDETGLAENTLVIFTSDNGGQTGVGADNGPWRDGKGTAYEGGIRVPMLARWPGRIEPGTTSEAIGLTMDLCPTIQQAAGRPAREPMHGISLVPVLLGQAEKTPPRDLFWVRLEGGRGQPDGWWLWAARRGDWKIIRRPDQPDQLFNLRQDPYEENDLANTEPERLRAMQYILDCHIADTAAVPWRDCTGFGPGEITDEPQ